MGRQEIILITKLDGGGVQGCSFIIEDKDLYRIFNKYQFDGCSVCAGTLNEVLEELKE